MKRFLCVLLCVAMVMSCMGTAVFANTVTPLISGLDDYCHYSTSLTNDGYIGIPVDICTYYKEGETTEWSPIMLYVINTNTERVGTDSDQSIVQSLIDRGFVVVVLDYKNNPKSVSPDLDWSIQAIRDTIGKGTHLNGAPCKWSYTYVLPAGYNIVYNDVYWSIDKHASLGSLEAIVEIWNNDFKTAKATKQITLQNGTTTTVADYEVNDIYDCVKTDGTPINLDLSMDVIYPTNPENEVPVMVCISSSETRVDTWTSSKRPHLTGFLFDGYAGVVSDYAYVPMARTDHYGYYDGNGAGGTAYVSGDNYTYSLSVYNGIKSDSAVMRKIRSMADITADGATDAGGNDTREFKFDVDKIGVYGNSKGGMCTRLGNPNYETLPEQRYFEGHRGETRLEAIQEDGYEDPYINDARNVTAADGSRLIDDPEEQPYLTYADGSKIPSNANFVYANCGGGAETIVEGNAPMYGTGTMEANGSYYGFYPSVMNACRVNDVPFFGLANPGVGHAFGYGMDRDYGIDVYNAFRIYANYWLKNDNAVCEYIDIEKTDNASVTDPITIQFTGSVSAEEIQKVTVTNDETNEVAEGTWIPSYGRTQWKFVPHTIKGGSTYTVNVPQTLCAENGKPLAEGKSASFSTKAEKLSGAVQILGSSTVSDTNPAYVVFADTDYSNSTTVDLRFSVTNDAANTVEIYPVISLDESNIEASVTGEKLGEIVLTGAGDYEFDVSEYVKTFAGKPAFMLKTKKTPARTVISNYDFNTEAYKGFTFGPLAYTTVSDEIKDESGNDNNSAKVNYFIRNSSWIDSNNDLKGNFVANMTQIAQMTHGVFPNGAVTAADYGRKFNVGVKVYDTTERLFRVAMSKTNTGTTVDWNSNTYTFKTEKDQWKSFDFDYMIDNEDYWGALDKRTIVLSSETKSVAVLDPYAAVAVSGFASSKGLNSSYTKYSTAAAAQAAGKVVSVDDNYTYPLYYDDIVITEITTEAQLGTETGASSIRPSLVLHPADKYNLPTIGEAYVENGDESDTYFGGSGTLFVSGRAAAPDTSSEKTYVKLSLADYEGTIASFEFATKEGSAGTIQVYGVADAAAASAWQPLTITPMNAPANDRYGYGVDKTKVFEGAPLAEVSVNGANIYAVDITEYAREMKNAGAQSITLILVNTSEDKKAVYTENFEDNVDEMGIYQGGDPLSRGKSTEYDHTTGAGASYKFLTAHNYDRLKIGFTKDHTQLSESDLGRKFRVSFWAYVPGEIGQTGSFNIGEMALRESRIVNAETVSIPLGTWTHFTRDITLSEMADWESGTEEYKSFHNTGVNAFVDIENIKNGEVASATNNVAIYIDDVSVSEVGMGSAEIEPSDFSDQNKVRINSVDFTGWTSTTNFAQSGFSNTTEKVYSIVTTEGPDGTEGKSALIQPSQTYNRVKLKSMFNSENTWTESDIGKTFCVTFWAKSDTVGSFSYGLMSIYARNDTPDGTSTYYVPEGYTPDRKSYAENLYGTAGVANITDDDINQWKKYSYTFTVDANMLPVQVIRRSNGQDMGMIPINCFSIIPNGLTVNSGTDAESIALRSKLYIDDIVVDEILDVAEAPHEYIQGFESVSSLSNVLIMSGAEYGKFDTTETTRQQIDKATISTETSYTGSKSMKMYSTKTYNRFKFQNTLPTLTESDIGKTYRASFYLKADKPGSFYVAMTRVGTETEQKQTYTISEDEVNTWKKYTYDFTITQEVIDGNNQPTIVPSGFGQTSTFVMDTDGIQLLVSADPVILYIDDLYIREMGAVSGTSLPIEGVASICASRATSTTSLGVSRGNADNIKNVRKTYWSFAGGSTYIYTQKATLSFDAVNATNQTVKVYAIINSDYPSNITYNNAPANTADESMDAIRLYGGSEIAEITLNGAGHYSVDVTDYVTANAPNNYIFALASSDNGGVEYANLDFDTFAFTEGLDYTALGGYPGTVSLVAGKAAVSGVTGSGQGISVLNVFGNAACTAGETYVVSADVTPAEDGEFTIGLSDGAYTLSSGSNSAQISANTTQTIELTYTVTQQDVSNGICAAAVYSNDGVDFTIDNLKVKKYSAVEIEAGSARLEVEAAQMGAIECSAEIMPAKGGADSIISMTFDDGDYDSTVYLNDAFSRYNLRGSTMLIVKNLDSASESRIAQWKQIYAQGFLEPESHSYTHDPIASAKWISTQTEATQEQLDKYNADAADATKWNYELVDSRNKLKEYFPEYDFLAFAASNNTLSDGAYDVARQTYYAVRTGAAGSYNILKNATNGPAMDTASKDSTVNINGTADPGSWHNLYMRTLQTNVATIETLKEYIDNGIAQGAWMVTMSHGVGAGSTSFPQDDAETIFAYISEKQEQNKIWSATFGEATKYVRERQNSVVDEYETEDGLFVELTMASVTEDGLPLTADVFDYPLTVKAAVPNGWTQVTYTQNGVSSYADVFGENGLSYAYIDIIPNGGVTKLEESQTVSDEPKSHLAADVVGNGTLKVNGEDAVSVDADYYRDTAFALEAVASEGYKFAYWMDAVSNRIVSTEPTYDFVLGMGRTLKAVFVQESADVKVVIFKNKNNQILLNETIGSDGSVTVPSNPMYMGYDFVGWLKGGIDAGIVAGDSLLYEALEAGENMYDAKYEKATDEYVITVENGTIVSPESESGYLYDTKVKVKATVPEGQVFAYWTKDGEIVSYSEEYEFYVSGTMTVTANFADVAPAKEPVLAMSGAVVMSGMNRIAYFAERNLPIEYTLVEMGIILRSGSAAENSDLSIDTAALKGVSTSKGNVGQFTVRKANLSVGDTWSARAYMVYIDGEGNLVTKYSNVVDGTYAE